MKFQPFKLERYFARYEFSAKYLLCSSDCDGLAVSDLLSLADEETRKMWQELKVGYTESLGLPLLRQEIIKLYQGINQDDVLVAAPEEGIFIAMNVLLNKGDHIICTFPGYQSLYEIAHSLGCEVTKWVLDEEKDWGVNLTFIEKNIKKNTKLIIINFPHNPTGSLINK
ncbi:MAG: Aminotransferase [Candidatus Gottesmanbacteria bacterium GW2011_GWC2_42_8]|nr:MAG: Aminotransferase [Candidatus Gottesmanbacteria bacterium GW2011_GWC2_42_8]